MICALNCHNLITVAKAVRDKYPSREIIICADNDQFTAGNPGLTAATEAAHAIQAKIATPIFADVTSKPTDFNDLERQEGTATVKNRLKTPNYQKKPTTTHLNGSRIITRRL